MIGATPDDKGKPDLAEVATAKQRRSSRTRVAQIAALLAAIGVSATIYLLRHQIQGLGNYGYFGVFLISVLASSTIVVTVPGWLIIASFGTVLNPYLVGIVSAAGATVGELTGYMLGYGGRMAFNDTRVYLRMVRWMKRWGAPVIIFLAAIPNPVFDIAGAVAGALRLPVWKFMLFGFVGRTPKHIVFALFGPWGLAALKFLQ